MRVALAAGLALLSGIGGLLASFHADLPAGPAIVFAAGLLYLLSLCLSPGGLFGPRLYRRSHLER